MYQIRCGDYLLLDMRDNDLILESCRLQTEVNTAGSLQFKIYPNHPYYNILKKLSSIIEVLKNGKVIFKGRLMEDKQTFYNAKDCSCEGKLAFLNDSIHRPFEFSGSPEELFVQIIENHNSQVKPFQQFKVGRVTVTDPNDYIVRSSEKGLSSWELMKTRLFDSSLGGYLYLRHEDDGDYLDYLADFDKVSSQPIQFGENLLDIYRDISAEETYTAMIPLGAETEDDKRIDVTSVNNGLDYIVNEEKAQEYGIIYAPEEVSVWEDVTLPANLLKKAWDYLNGTGIKLKETIELSAVDLNLTDSEIDSFNICDYISVVSELHGVNERYLLRRMDIDLINLQNTRISLGESRRTLADFQIQTEKKTGDVSSRLDNIENDYISSGDAEQLVNEKAAAAAEGKVAEVMDGFISSSFAEGDNIDLTVNEKKQLVISAVIPEGISPTITEETNTDEEYVLNITDVNGSYSTPNLRGKDGRQGEDGEPGQAATIKIGTVTTGAAGTQAEVHNSGTDSAVVLDFVIPRGEKGSPGSGSGGDGGGGSTGIYAFEVREDGHLWLVSEDEEKADNFYIDVDGHLKYIVEG